MRTWRHAQVTARTYWPQWSEGLVIVETARGGIMAPFWRRRPCFVHPVLSWQKAVSGPTSSYFPESVRNSEKVMVL